MEGTQKPWWKRSVCCCLGFVKPFIVTLLQPWKCQIMVLLTISITKLNTSGWQRLSCLVLFFFFLISQFVHWLQKKEKRGTCSFLITCPLALQEGCYASSKRIKPNSISHFPLYLGLSDLWLTSSPYWEYTFADQNQTPVPTTPCIILLYFPVYLSTLTKIFTFYEFTHMVWKNFLEKKEKADGLSRFEIVLYFSQKRQETGGTTLDLSLLVKETKQLQGRRKASKLSLKMLR